MKRMKDRVGNVLLLLLVVLVGVRLLREGTGPKESPAASPQEGREVRTAAWRRLLGPPEPGRLYVFRDERGEDGSTGMPGYPVVPSEERALVGEASDGSLRDPKSRRVTEVGCEILRKLDEGRWRTRVSSTAGAKAASVVVYELTRRGETWVVTGERFERSALRETTDAPSSRRGGKLAS
jgi:hypothetical protein